MNKLINEVLKELENSFLGIKGYSEPSIVNLFTLYSFNNQHVFTIKADGNVEVDPKFTAQQAVDEFWNWLANQTNLVQAAVAQARREERDAVVKEIENLGAQHIADIIRK